MKHLSVRQIVVLTFAMGLVPMAQADPQDAPHRAPGAARRKLERASRATLSGEIRKMQNLREQMLARLELDDLQKEDVNAMFDEYIAELKEDARTQRESRREHAALIRDLVRELSEARADDDHDRMAEIRAEIADLRAQRDAVRTDHEPFYEYVAEVLDDRQFEQFDQLIKRLERSPGRGTDAWEEIQRMRRAASTIEASPEQKHAVRAIFRDLAPQFREARGDQEAMSELVDLVYDQLSREFDRDQMLAFEEKLTHLRQAAAARARGPRHAGRTDAPPADADGVPEAHAEDRLDPDAPEDEQLADEAPAEDETEPDQYDDSGRYD